MEIKYHIGFRANNAPDLVCYLRKKNIPYNEESPIHSADIYESSPHWQDILWYIHKYKLVPIVETVYSDAELNSAMWLRVRSKWKNGYPQPEDNFNYEQITYTDKFLCNKCGCGLTQVYPFRLEKQPNWGQRHFFELNWIGDELFVSEKGKTILKSRNTSGIDFEVVLNKSGKSAYSNVSQVVIPFMLEKGLVTEQTDLKKQSICPCCGKPKYAFSGRGPIAFKKDVFKNAPDVVKTFEEFGEGHFATRLIIVRQNVYQTIKANHLDRGLVFEPVKLV